jgi:chromosome segregation ATPase
MTIDLDPNVLAYLAAGVVLAFLALIGAVAMAARALKTASQANGRLSDTLMKLNDELQEHSADRRSWEASRRGLNIRIEHLETDLAASTEKVERLETRAGEQRTVIDQLSGELVRVKELLVREQDARKAELAAANETIAGLQQEIACLHTGNNIAREKIQQLEGQISAYEETIRRLEGEIQRLQRDLAAAQRAKVEAETKLEQERRAMQEQIDALSARLESSPAVTSTADLIVNPPSNDGQTERIEGP